MTDALTFLNIVQDQLALAELPNGSDRFVADLGCDSLEMIELVMAAEDEFSIDVDDDEAEKLTTVQEAVDYIAARLAELPVSSEAASGCSHTAEPNEQDQSGSSHE